MSIEGQRIPAHLAAYRDIKIYPIAKEDGLPVANATIPDPLKIDAELFGFSIQYKLFAQCRQDKNGIACLYYIAYNVGQERNEYAVGPAYLDAFHENIGIYATGAGNFFGLTGHVSDYQVKSAAFTEAIVSGRFKHGFRKLGSAWLSALQDPAWWIGATLGTTAGVSRMARTAAARIIDPTKYPAYNRAMQTQLNQQSKLMERSIQILEEPTTFRHTITSDIPEVAMARIEMEGSLRISSGVNAHYGEGVYAWPKNGPTLGRYIDIEAPPGTAAELIQVQSPAGAWYRLVPPVGNRLPVKITGHNFTPEEVSLGRAMVAE